MARPRKTRQTSTPASGLYLTRPADACIDALAVVTHSNQSPGAQAGTNPFFWTDAVVALLTDLGIRYVRDDPAFDLPSLKGGDTSFAAGYAKSKDFHRACMNAGIGVGVPLHTPQGVTSMVTAQAEMPEPYAWVEGPNEFQDYYESAPTSYSQYSPPKSYGGTGWGGTPAAWQSGQAYTAGMVRYIGAGNWRWLCIGDHTSASGNQPPTDTVTGTQDGEYFFEEHDQWVPAKWFRYVNVVKLLRNLRDADTIDALTDVHSQGATAGGTPDNLATLRSSVYASKAMFGTFDHGAEFGDMHGYGAGGDAYVTSVLGTFNAQADIRAAFPKGIVIGENGFTTSNSTEELATLTNAGCAMVEAYRSGMKRVAVYQFIDEYVAVNGAYPSPVGTVSSPDWQTYGLASLNNVVLSGASSDFRKKNGWTQLKNLLAALADPGTQPQPKSFFATIGSLGSMRAPLVLNRRDGTYDIVLSSSTGSNVTGVTIAPASGVTWSSVGIIDPANGSTLASADTLITSGDPYSTTITPFPCVIRVTQ